MLEAAIHAHRTRGERIARLYLNDVEVGFVIMRSQGGSWGFGEFLPMPAFSQFAPLFGCWSLLMHVESAEERLSSDASEELRATESELDALRAKLLIEKPQEWREVRQVNIDGTLIEWKE